MLRPAPFLALTLAIGFARAFAQQSSAGAVALLDRVADHYAQAKTIHLEATVRVTSQSDLYTFTHTSILTVWTAPDGRFRYEGHTSNGSALLVSDGTSEWHLRRSFDEYDKGPTGAYFRQPSVYGGDDDAITEAHALLKTIVEMRGKIDLARFAPSQTMAFNGRRINCTVVQFEYAQAVARDPSQPIPWRNTLWIDPATLTVLKLRVLNRYQQMQGMVTPPHALWRENGDETLFTVANLSATPTPGIFSFVPPAGTVQVASLPPLFATPGSRNAGMTVAATQFLNKPLPPVVLHDAAGAEVPLSRYHGHPLLIDVWATWCGPCLDEMPELAKLRATTAATDLQIIGVDEDNQPSDAIRYLKEKGYDWPNFHLNAAAQKQLSAGGIPLLILVDANGTVVFHSLGGGNMQGLTNAVRKLGPAYASASAQ